LGTYRDWAARETLSRRNNVGELLKLAINLHLGMTRVYLVCTSLNMPEQAANENTASEMLG